MRYIKSGFAAFAFVLATSCAVDIIEPELTNKGYSDAITVMGRINRFEDKDVTTRAAKDPNTEGNLYNMAIALFPIEDGVIGKCDFFEYKVGSEVLFTIDRQIKDDNDDYIYQANTPYVMYVFANCSALSNFTIDKTLDEMKAVVSSVNGLDIPKDGDNVGFPMIGSLGDTVTPEGDGKTFVLKPGTDQIPELPSVNNDKTDLLTIPLSALFAKINFTIKVAPDQTVAENPSPRFTLESYKVNNVPNAVTFSKDANSVAKTAIVPEDAVASYDGLPITSQTNYAMGATNLTFSFYVPERLLSPATSADDYDYPFGEVGDGDIDKNNNGIRDEDEKYRQRFKNLLPNKGQRATYVTITGKFRDHQNHIWDVTYDIYLGEDNYSNFEIRRNFEYNNFITIRGIQSASDMANNENAISIDHRVNVERTQPAIISLRRETLLDSHFEVRPLRIKKNDDVTVASATHALVEVVYADGEDNSEANPYWIGLEHKNNATNLSYYLPSGMRKYFTTDLVTSTLAGLNTNYSKNLGQQVVVPITATTECVWIYVDECTKAGDNVRKASIRITYGVLNDTKFTPTTDSAYPPIDYTINQRYLFPITYGSNTYYVEYEEEYLHNFDAEDNYGSTEDEGMVWGLNGVQLSNKHRAYFATGTFASIMNWLLDSDMDVMPYYDFYLTRDTEESSATRRDNSGSAFVNKIIAYQPIEFYPITLEDLPSSAIEYCYNRNKRNADGTISTTVWYMPAIDEIENIMKGEYIDAEGAISKSYIRFADFQGKMYWSCQPAYLRGYGYYHSLLFTNYADYYFDDKTSARATKIVYNNGYTNISSGVDGYDQVMDIYKPITGTSNKPVIIPVTSDNQTISCQNNKKVTIAKKTDVTNHPGNLPRNSKARVRCVRKMN